MEKIRSIEMQDNVRNLTQVIADIMQSPTRAIDSSVSRIDLEVVYPDVREALYKTKIDTYFAQYSKRLFVNELNGLLIENLFTRVKQDSELSASGFKQIDFILADPYESTESPWVTFVGGIHSHPKPIPPTSRDIHGLIIEANDSSSKVMEIIISNYDVFVLMRGEGTPLLDHDLAHHEADKMDALYNDLKRLPGISDEAAQILALDRFAEVNDLAFFHANSKDKIVQRKSPIDLFKV